ncbi:MAG: DM13 domain-containing protein [Rhodospirillaceae bacterium]|jgi:hypothetical protein|nr:DM13 domain-containing protein [Rhodospirillaceae bacterium]MBT4590151.1 DM13 domain-containing protein [Rhodospirillaceae bacterium]MBT4939933.1 DM13 domain-containing protein [Rhodospirillaceae bacterium]MBT5940548.1 DM13 domain-containing protein [Rhodospirillaceae bacterium]MBT7269151.1 DM13 domain-containing protein [Rhodospirillaceae bacterium]
MRKWLLVVAIVWIVGFVMGNAFWYLASPLWIDRVVSEQVPDSGQFTALKTGTFKNADGAHHGQGTATITETRAGQKKVSFTGFEVTNGPDLKVYAVESSNITDSNSVLQSRRLNLGTLKGNIGNQNYALPADLDFTVGAIVIWCEQFSVLFSAATLK